MESKEQNLTVRHLAHDLNNILSRILNSVELLKKKIPVVEDTEHLLASIENGTYLASEIVEDVLSDSTQKVSRKKKINVNRLIIDLVNTINVHVRDRIIINTNLDPELPFIEGRYTDYYRVIMNLLVNASEAIKGKGNITITTQFTKMDFRDKNQPSLFETKEVVYLQIADSGMGIDKSVMPHIFEDQFTTKSKRDRSPLHSKNGGFGLAIVKKIIDANDGIITVTSEKNQGTEFSICFPAVSMAKSKVVKSKNFILVAEDEDIQRQLLTELLESYGFNVLSVSTGEEVLDKIKSNSPDLLIIDRQLPGMNGTECIRKVKEMKNHTPIILASGSVKGEAEDDESEVLADKKIYKPYNFEEMLIIIRSLIEV